MREVIFSKYNRTRDPKYRISTFIVEQDGTCFVEKSSLDERAVSHIESLLDKSKICSKAYKGLHVLIPELKEGIAVYPYVQGQTLDRLLLQYIRDPQELMIQMKEWNEKIFSLTDDAYTDQSKTVVRFANLDLLYENIMVSEAGELTLIDCEWVFEEETAVSYMMFRCLNQFYEKYSCYLENKISFSDFLHAFGLTQQMGNSYAGKEQAFQELVRGNELKYSYTSRYAKMCSPISNLTEYREDLTKAHNDITRLNSLIRIKEDQIAERSHYAKELEGIIEHIRHNPMYRIGRIPVKAAKVLLPESAKKRLKEGKLPQLVFEKQSDPLVSIVIPVYNQFDYTYRCLASIIENTKDVAYEVILADDVSTDRTKRIEKCVKNLTISRNSTNTGFLLNCNQGAQKAKGKYIIFLNNDTTVSQNWLSSMVRLAETDDKIGLVGSKLVYPNGQLQEAGGIIWSNGDGCNYGRYDNPDKPEYNYVKEIDYISGASIMVKRELFEKLGGFDKQFAPAYYEDTDLAFSIRKLGYKVMYQPLSVITHYEGISNGTDISEGLKKYQAENRVKFLKKWQDELKNHEDSMQDLFIAREKSKDKKIIVFIDRFVPNFDKDAGSKSTYNYMKLFQHMGYEVKFIPDDYKAPEPYTCALQQDGIEVLFGDEFCLHMQDWFIENGKWIDLAFVNRPHVADNFMKAIRANNHTRILFYGHDLHYVRESREAALTGNKEEMEHARTMKLMEFDIMKQADVVYYPSYVETDAIKAENPSINAKAIPVYVYDKADRSPVRKAKDRKDMMFIGGFAHGPNVDAMLWFTKEVLPLVLEKLTDFKFYILGSAAPQEILSLAGEHIEVVGFVSEDELKEYYRNVRLVVVPLRYGAGMKGKVIESLYYSTPIITTSIGAEGLREYQDVLVVEDEAQKMADQIIKLYQNEEQLDMLSKAMPDYIDQYFSMAAAQSILEEDL